MERNYFEHIKRLQALAEIGLAYSDSNYDIERYEEIQEICLEMLEQLTDVPVTKNQGNHPGKQWLQNPKG